ncbi:hypothetical protein [Lysobacter antibioticus]|uniref:hypothetical protein n=1 Tax=Lysobacter antibioticus TaxID=84531 RepID=UPI0004CFF3DA|nr:hypothetical protein [Lysobacter antibioticus]
MRYLMYAAVLVLLAVGDAKAEPVATDIVVRAKARDGKFIGSSIGGAWVRIKDADSDKVLAEGLTEGGTGDTEAIMSTPRTRYGAIAGNAAAFKARLLLDRPVFATVEVLAPYIKKQARTVSQTQLWLVPGKPIAGDGLIVEVPGMIVDILSPGTHLYTPLSQAPYELKANVVMMCGCILTEGGTWDGKSMDVAAIVEKDGRPYKTIPLQMQATMNTFRALLEPDAPGNYRITVYAYDPKTGNTGVDQTSFVVTK